MTDIHEKLGVWIGMLVISVGAWVGIIYITVKFVKWAWYH